MIPDQTLFSLVRMLKKQRNKAGHVPLARSGQHCTQRTSDGAFVYPALGTYAISPWVVVASQWKDEVKMAVKEKIEMKAKTSVTPVKGRFLPGVAGAALALVAGVAQATAMAIAAAGKDAVPRRNHTERAKSKPPKTCMPRAIHLNRAYPSRDDQLVGCEGTASDDCRVTG